jgi:hypothetical protein
VTPDALRPLARHEADDQGSGDGHGDLLEAELIAGWGHHAGVPAPEEEEIGEEADQLEQRERDERAETPMAMPATDIGTSRQPALKSPRSCATV